MWYFSSGLVVNRHPSLFYALPGSTQPPNGPSSGFSNILPLTSGSVKSLKMLFAQGRCSYVSTLVHVAHLNANRKNDTTIQPELANDPQGSERVPLGVHPREHIVDLFPPLHPCEFSIASASWTHPNEVHLCVGAIDHQTKLKRSVGMFFLTSHPVGA